MKRNWQYIAVGLLLGVAFTLLLGAGAGETGRYQGSSAGNMAWVMDTETGQLWVTEKRLVEPDSKMIVAQEIQWFNYGVPRETGR